MKHEQKCTLCTMVIIGHQYHMKWAMREHYEQKHSEAYSEILEFDKEYDSMQEKYPWVFN